MTLYNEIPQRVNEIKTKFPVENEMLLLRHFAIRAIIMNRDEDDEVYHIKSEPLIRVILTGHVHFDFVSNLTPSLTQILTAGGYEGVGIGSGACGSCGDITISGGTVTAEAGYGWYCPGIGAGKEQATCGNILIKNTVTEVWAVSNAENAPVGAGQSSTCGIVRIESGANVNLI